MNLAVPVVDRGKKRKWKDRQLHWSCRRAEKVVGHEGDCAICRINCNGHGRETERIGDKRKNWDHLDFNITRIIKYVSRLFSYGHFYWQRTHKTLVPFEVISSGWNALVRFQQLLEGSHRSPLVWACQWLSSQPHSSPQLSHNDSIWA